MTESSREHLLVVDDDPSVRALFAQVFADAGYVVECASDAPTALGVLRTEQIALALVDLKLPGISGAELVEAMSSNWPDVAVVIVTGVHSISTAVSYLRAGAYDYLTKPVDIEDMTDRVKRALHRRRLILEGRRHQQRIRDAAFRETKSSCRLFLGAINALSSALEAKDEYTRGHSERVSSIAGTLGQAIGLRPDELRRLRLAGRLHDIGKIGVRESILLKPGKLTDQEYREIQVHSVVGERILAPVLRDDRVVGIVRHHHESYDGGGYPDGLTGSAIPLGARLLAVADAFDALTSDRPYRSRLSPSGALAVLRAGAGAQWQPTFVETLFQRLEAVSPIVYRSHDRAPSADGENPPNQGQAEAAD